MDGPWTFMDLYHEIFMAPPVPYLITDNPLTEPSPRERPGTLTMDVFGMHIEHLWSRHGERPVRFHGRRPMS